MPRRRLDEDVFRGYLIGEAVRATSEVAVDWAASDGDCLGVAAPFMTLMAVAGCGGAAVVGFWSALALDIASAGLAPLVTVDCEAIDPQR